MHGLAVEDERFQFAMGIEQDRAAGCLVYPVGFHTHQPVLHQVDAPDPVRPTDGIEPLDDLRS